MATNNIFSLKEASKPTSAFIPSTATDVLLILQRSPYRGTDAWEAVATALIAQGRYAEAEEYYECIVKRGNSLPERPSTVRRPLFEAAQHGHNAAARFLLLEAGARPDIPVVPVVPVVRSPADIAAYMGEVDILRLFTQHTPTIQTAHTSSGKLHIEPAIRGQRVNVINFLVKEVCVDIKAADEKGQIALHLAVDSNNKKVVAAVITLGANVKAVNKYRQAVFKRAVSRNCRITGWLT
ncbi:ankyrin repeat-containing domain protein [Ilyonectria destructans]|nr:ankyrin repeat-containing domain protein [Ilyonectria destructans]